MNFAESFSRLLDSKGITPYRMYKDTGIPEATIGRWKNGKAIPHGEKLQLIADYFGVSADYLIGHEFSYNLVIEAIKNDPLKQILNHIKTSFSYEEFEQALELPAKTVESWENGASKTYLHMLYEISRLFNVTIDSLYVAPENQKIAAPVNSGANYVITGDDNFKGFTDDEINALKEAVRIINNLPDNLN
jgi:Predicted transcriptional regulators